MQTARKFHSWRRTRVNEFRGNFVAFGWFDCASTTRPAFAVRAGVCCGNAFTFQSTQSFFFSVICRNQIRLREACNFRKKINFIEIVRLSEWIGKSRTQHVVTFTAALLRWARLKTKFNFQTTGNYILVMARFEFNDGKGRTSVVMLMNAAPIGAYWTTLKVFWKFPPRNSFICWRCPWLLICFEDWNHNKTYSAMTPQQEILRSHKNRGFTWELICKSQIRLSSEILKVYWCHTFHNNKSQTKLVTFWTKHIFQNMGIFH